MTELERRRGPAALLASPPTDNPTPAPTASQWLTEFGAVDVAAIEAEIRAEPPATKVSDDPSASRSDERNVSPKGDSEDSIFPTEFFAAPDREDDAENDHWNPFPPGYGADIDADDER
jgi:hypothetical protein